MDTQEQPHTPTRRRRLGTINEVADILAVRSSTAYDLARQNRIPGVVRMGRLVRVDLDVLDDWIAEGGQSLPQDPGGSA